MHCCGVLVEFLGYHPFIQLSLTKNRTPSALRFPSGTKGTIQDTDVHTGPRSLVVFNLLNTHIKFKIILSKRARKMKH